MILLVILGYAAIVYVTLHGLCRAAKEGDRTQGRPLGVVRCPWCDGNVPACDVCEGRGVVDLRPRGIQR